MPTSEQNRPYRKHRRAATEAATRERIVAATRALHADVGPAATSIAEVARRAGVQRATVYAHFASDFELFAACNAAAAAEVKPPDPRTWQAEATPQAVLRRGLREIFGVYAQGGDPLALALRDAAVLPVFAEVIEQGFGAWLTTCRSVLAQAAGTSRPATIAVDVMTSHATWATLRPLGEDRAVEIAARMIEAAPD